MPVMFPTARLKRIVSPRFWNVARPVAGEALAGMFTGIDGAGALLLGTEDGVRRVGLGAALLEPSWGL